MEGITDIGYAANGVSDGETITCNMPAVVIPSIDNCIGAIGSDVQNLSNHLTDNASENDLLSSRECLNGISPVYEVANSDTLQDNYNNIAVGNEANSVSKVVPPTIFENAVKVVKNLFSPAKGHGIFSRGKPNAAVNEVDATKIHNEDIHSIGGSLLLRLDQASPTEKNDRLSPLMSEEDMNNSTMKNFSNSLGVLDNTNDSYTTTVSIMDESFQSTITHFDENVPKETEISKVPVITVENGSDGSLNETVETNENSLDNTLKKNLSICSTVNGDLNETFEAGSNKLEDGALKESVSEGDSAVIQSSNPISPVAEDVEKVQEVTTSASPSDANFLSFQEEGMLKIGTSSSTPNKRNSSAEISPSEKSFLNLISGKFQEFDRKLEENIVQLNNCTTQDTDNVQLNQFSGMNQPSENDFSLFPVGSEEEFTQKSSTPKAVDVEKNFSTSTIILNKEEPECSDFGNAKEENEAIPSSFGSVKKNEGRIVETKSAVEVNQCKELSNNISESSMYSEEKRGDLEVKPKLDVLLKSLNLCDSNSEISLKPDVANVDFKALTVSNDLRVRQLKNEGYPPDETGIPLASQKSYTVLHNQNPGLNRPVVLDYTCDVHAENLNDIIMGNCTFSDTGVFNNCSDELIADGSKNALNISSSHGLTNSLKSDERKSDNVDTSVSEKVSDVLIHAEPELNVFPMVENRKSEILMIDNVKVLNQSPAGSQSQNGTPAPVVEAKELKTESTTTVYHDADSAFENTFEVPVKEIKEKDTSLSTTSVIPLLGDGVQNESNTENNLSALQFCGDGSLPSTEVIKPVTKNENQILREPDCSVMDERSSNSNTEIDFHMQMENLTCDLERLKMNDSTKQDSKCNSPRNDSFQNFGECLVPSEENRSCENLKPPVKAPGLGGDAELTQFIQEQFTAFDIEKICSVVDDIPELNLSKNIVLASEKFDQSFHEKTETDSPKPNNFMNDNNFLSSALDFLDSIKGKPSGRDYSRESLYVKFDPLVQTKHTTQLLDISEGDKENLIISPGPKNNGNAETLIAITPLKQTSNVGSPLSPFIPVNQKNEPKLSTEKLNKLLELQNEITKLREYSSQREEMNKEKLNNYEKEIAKLTGRACVLEDRLKESEEMEKSLVKKLNVQNESMNRMKNIVEGYLTCIGKLTDQIETSRMESQKKVDVLTEERNYFMNHLQSTEQAFSDVHSKYEKCKKAVEVYKKNEETYKTSIDELKEKIEQYGEKIKDIQENAAKEMCRLQEKINDMKLNHAQEISRFKAQLRKTELKLQTVQDALDQKVKENQELARICDELIDGKK